MEIRFNAVKEARKALVNAIGEILGMEVKYLGAPGFTFAVGDLVVDKNGAVDCGGQMNGSDAAALIAALAERGFVPAETPAIHTGDALAECDDVTVRDAAEPDDNVSAARTEPGAGSAGDSETFITSGAELSRADTTDTFAIEVSDENVDAIIFDNLLKLTAGKAALIQKALGPNLMGGAEALPILREDGKIRFPWFVSDMASHETAAWACFIGALCATAEKQKRVTLKAKALEPGDSEKFAFRCFLLKLGFIGDEYKEARKVLLARLTGDGSHKTGNGKKADADAPKGGDKADGT